MNLNISSIQKHVRVLGADFKRELFHKLSKSAVQKRNRITGTRIISSVQLGIPQSFEKIELSYFFIEPNVSKLNTIMDWINCNSCCRQPGDDKDRIFMLSSCGHIFCDFCLSKLESKDKCKVCSTQCQLIPLSSKMKPDTQIFFQDPANLLKQHQIQLTRLLEFQKEHRTRLVTFHRKMLFKYKELEGNYKLASEKIQHLERENSSLKKILNSGNSGGGVGTIENGGIVGYSQSPHYATPHESYQRAISASGNKMSPQVSSSFISPGVSRISPGRLTLVKANSPSNKLNNQISSFSSQESFNKGTSQYPSPRTQASSLQFQGSKLNADVASGPQYCSSLSSDGKRTPSPAMSRLCSSSVVSSPSVMYQSFQPSQSNHYSQAHLANQPYSHLPPGSMLVKHTTNHMQRGNFSNGQQPMTCSPDPSLLHRSLVARTFTKY